MHKRLQWLSSRLLVCGRAHSSFTYKLDQEISAFFVSRISSTRRYISGCGSGSSSWGSPPPSSPSTGSPPYSSTSWGSCWFSKLWVILDFCDLFCYFSDCKVRHKYDEDITKCLEYVLSKSQVGDWFVLYQLSKNCNPYFYREFIRELAIELKLRPKKTKSRGSVGNACTAF